MHVITAVVIGCGNSRRSASDNYSDITLTFGKFYIVIDGWSLLGLGTFSSWHNGLSHKKSALTKQAPNSTWDEVNRIWLSKEAMWECTF